MIDEEEFIKQCLSKIDNNEKLSEREIRDLLEYKIMKDEGEDRRWSKSVRTLVQLENRYFIIDWESGLTEYQDDSYLNQPKEVFNPKYKQYTSYITIVYDKEGKSYSSFDGLLNEYIEEDKE